MKKFFPLLIVMLLLVTGCGSDDKIKVGTIKYLNVTEEDFAKFQGQNPNDKHIFFDNMNSLTAALQAGQIDEMCTYESVANYFIRAIRILNGQKILPPLSICFVVQCARKTRT